jgi:hypothetical protein
MTQAEFDKKTLRAREIVRGAPVLTDAQQKRLDKLNNELDQAVFDDDHSCILNTDPERFD